MKSELLQVLLADDDPDDCALFTEAMTELTPSAFVHAVHDSDQLLLSLQHTEHALPDFLFIDFTMPRKNGLQCLIPVKRNQRLANISVILCTWFEKTAAGQLHARGAHACIKKPASFAAWKRAIRQIITKHPSNI